MTITVRDATSADHAAILALNQESEALLSPLDLSGLSHLSAQAAYHRVLCDRDKVVGFLLVLREGAACDERELRAFVGSRVADFKIPRRIVFLEEIPKGATGKLQRIGLHEKLAQKLGTAG